MRVTPVRRSLGTAVAALVALGAVGPPPASAAPETFDGTVQPRIADDFRGGRSVTTYALRRPGGRDVVLRPSDAGERRDLEALSGTTVRVRGTRTDGAVDVQGLEIARKGASTQSAVGGLGPGPGARRVDVFPTDIAGVSPGQSFTPAQIRDALADGAGSAAGSVRQQSGGRQDLAVTVHAPITVTVADRCDVDQIAAAVRASAAASGIELASSPHVAIMLPRQEACFAWAGLADLGGPTSWYNGYNLPETWAHELGHNIGLDHADLLQCGAASLASPASCTSDEYGDPFDYMGAEYRAEKALTSAFNRGQLGLLDDEAAVTRLDGAGQTGTVDLGAVNGLTGAREVLIPRRIAGRPTQFFSVELRTTESPFEAWAATDPVVRGVTVRLTPPPGRSGHTQLVDAAPATPTGDDAPFGAGSGITDADSGVRIGVQSIGSRTASLSVVGSTAPDATPPAGFATGRTSAPRTVAFDWSGVVDDEGAPVRIELLRDGAPVAEATGPGGSLSATAAHPDATTFELRATDAAGNARSLSTVGQSNPDVSSPTLTGVKVRRRTITWASTADDWGVRAVQIVPITGKGRGRAGKPIAEVPAANLRFQVPAQRTDRRYLVRAVDVVNKTKSSRVVVRHRRIHASRLRKMRLRLDVERRSRVVGRKIHATFRYPAGVRSMTLRVGRAKAVCARPKCHLRVPRAGLRRGSGTMSVRVVTNDGEPAQRLIRIRRGRVSSITGLR